MNATPNLDALADEEARERAAYAARRVTPSVLESVDWSGIGETCLTTPPAARRYLLRVPDVEGGHGAMPRGKAGIFAAEGGSGKTSAVVALAISLQTGHPWLGHFVPAADPGGRALVILAEEDQAEAHRKLWTVAEAYQLSWRERAALAGTIVVVPAAGKLVALTSMSNGELIESPFARELRERLLREAGALGWSLIVLDPLSRFGGGDVEGDTGAATRFVEILETLTEAPGNPSVLVPAHSSKLARRQGQADVRGVTALTDGVRYVWTLKRDGEDVIFDVPKSNYTMPISPVRLRWANGILRAATGAEIAADATAKHDNQAAELDSDIDRVVEVLRREGELSSRDAIAHAAGLRAVRGRAALDLAVARGMVRRDGTARRPRYLVTTTGGVCSSPPLYPPDGGTASPPAGGTPSAVPRDGNGTARTAGRPSTQSGDPSLEEVRL